MDRCSFGIVLLAESFCTGIPRICTGFIESVWASCQLNKDESIVASFSFFQVENCFMNIVIVYELWVQLLDFGWNCSAAQYMLELRDIAARLVLLPINGMLGAWRSHEKDAKNAGRESLQTFPKASIRFKPLSQPWPVRKKWSDTSALHGWEIVFVCPKAHIVLNHK